jgi:hypothetical protein
MTKQLRWWFFQTLDLACRRRSPSDSAANILDHLIRESPVLWAEVKTAVSYDWALKMATVRCKGTNADGASQLIAAAREVCQGPRQMTFDFYTEET